MLLLCVFACLVEILVAICHVYHVPHAIDAILLISCLHACDVPCALFMTTICTHDILNMIPSSTLHLHTTSLLALIHMIACFVASPMFHYYLLFLG